MLFRCVVDSADDGDRSLDVPTELPLRQPHGRKQRRQGYRQRGLGIMYDGTVHLFTWETEERCVNGEYSKECRMRSRQGHVEPPVTTRLIQRTSNQEEAEDRRRLLEVDDRPASLFSFPRRSHCHTLRVGAGSWS